MSHWAIALRPFRLFADFRGRSTRTEVAAFLFTSQLIGVAGDIAGNLAGLPLHGGQHLASLVLLCPGLAVTVRRLHDGGRRGWWLLLALPGLAVGLRRDLLLWQDPFDIARAELPFSLQALLFLPVLALFALILAEGQEGPNGWGTNPRRRHDGLPERPGEPA
jgi:uncharacterized membrane protein YhaH (DUF805 family)